MKLNSTGRRGGWEAPIKRLKGRKKKGSSVGTRCPVSPFLLFAVAAAAVAAAVVQLYSVDDSQLASIFVCGTSVCRAYEQWLSGELLLLLLLTRTPPSTVLCLHHHPNMAVGSRRVTAAGHEEEESQRARWGKSVETSPFTWPFKVESTDAKQKSKFASISPSIGYALYDEILLLLH